MSGIIFERRADKWKETYEDRRRGMSRVTFSLNCLSCGSVVPEAFPQQTDPGWALCFLASGNPTESAPVLHGRSGYVYPMRNAIAGKAFLFVLGNVW